jgi:hypothetical protein
MVNNLDWTAAVERCLGTATAGTYIANPNPPEPAPQPAPPSVTWFAYWARIFTNSHR